MNVKIENCASFTDNRGSLVQFVSQHFLESNYMPFGQVYLLTFSQKGVVRGNHYHNYSSEVFCLISGTVELFFEDVVTKERITKVVSANETEFYRILVDCKIAHSIKSLSDFSVMVSFSSTEYDSYNEDKIPYRII